MRDPIAGAIESEPSCGGAGIRGLQTIHGFHAKCTMQRHGDRISIDMSFGKIQPKASAWLEVPFAVGAEQATRWSGELSVFADNLPEPIRDTVEFDIGLRDGEVLTLEAIKEWIAKNPEDDDR